MACPPCACAQAVLQQLAEEMFPEGQGKPNAKAKLAPAPPLRRVVRVAVVVSAKEAIDELWKARGYQTARCTLSAAAVPTLWELSAAGLCV